MWAFAVLPTVFNCILQVYIKSAQIVIYPFTSFYRSALFKSPTPNLKSLFRDPTLTNFYNFIIRHLLNKNLFKFVTLKIQINHWGHRDKPFMDFVFAFSIISQAIIYSKLEASQSKAPPITGPPKPDSFFFSSNRW